MDALNGSCSRPAIVATHLLVRPAHGRTLFSLFGEICFLTSVLSWSPFVTVYCVTWPALCQAQI